MVGSGGGGHVAANPLLSRSMFRSDGGLDGEAEADFVTAV
jgi:hypothetical protein